MCYMPQKIIPNTYPIMSGSIISLRSKVEIGNDVVYKYLNGHRFLQDVLLSPLAEKKRCFVISLWTLEKKKVL